MRAIHSEDFQLTALGHRLQARRLTPEKAGQGPVMVFLHEGLGSIPQWRDFPAQLCQTTGLRGLLYERWGFGGSDPLEGSRTPAYLHQEAQQSLPQVLEQCGIHRPILVGHSDGGTIALLYAAAYPQRVTAIVTEAAHVFVEELTLAGIREAVQAYEATALADKLARYHGSNTDSMFRGWSDTWLSPAFRDWNIVAQLPRIVCPSLILQGEDDQYGTPAQVAAIVEAIGQPARGVLIPGCAHVPHHQARERVLEEMVDFIAGVLD